MERIKRLTKETASIEPALERAVQPNAEKRITRGANKLLLHTLRRQKRA